MKEIQHIQHNMKDIIMCYKTHLNYRMSKYAENALRQF